MNVKFTLKIASISYLLLPTLLFLATWVKLIYGIPAIFMIGWIAFSILKKDYQQDDSDFVNKPTLSQLLLLFFIALLFNSLLGIGEFRQQTTDFMANNFKIYDLVTRPFPVYYPDYKVYLCYYNAYYLPTAYVGKLFGLGICRYFLLLWSALGMFLTIIWLFTFTRKRPFLLILICLSYNQSWIIIYLLRAINFQTAHFPPYFIQLNAFMLNINSFVNNYAWAPQHTIPASLGMCVVIHYFLLKINALPILLLVLLSTIFWSPFATIGLFPFVLVMSLQYLPTIFSKIYFSTLVGLLLLILAFCPVMLYLTSTKGVNADNTGFIWNTATHNWLMYYVFYLIIHVGLWYALVFRRSSPYYFLLIILFIVVALLATFRIGIMNDLNIRATIPLLFALSIVVALYFIEQYHLRSWLYYGAVLFFIANALGSWVYLGQKIAPSKPETSIEKPFAYGLTSMMQFQENMYGDKDAIKEYSLSEGSIFEVYLLRK